MMVNEDSKRDRNRNIGLVLLGVGFVLMLISAQSEMLGYIGFILLGGGLITTLTNLKKRHKKTK